MTGNDEKKTHSTDDDDDGDDDDDDAAFLSMNDVPVYFSEDWHTGIGGGLWSTGLAMAKYFERHADHVVDNLERLGRSSSSSQQCGRRSDRNNGETLPSDDDDVDDDGISAMELGSGNGFLSVCLLALFAARRQPTISLKELVVTDMADHLALMATTLKANRHVWDHLTVIEPSRDDDDDDDDDDDGSDGGTEEGGAKNKRYIGNLSSETTLPPPFDSKKKGQPPKSTTTPVTVAEHTWGIFPSSGKQQQRRTEGKNSRSHDRNDIHGKKYDFIFGTDLAYRNSLHDPLIASLLHFSHRHTLCLIGVTMTDTQPVFYDLLTKAGFRYEKLADHLLEREFRGGNFGILAIQRR